MNWILAVAIGIAIVTLVGGLVNWVILLLEAKRDPLRSGGGVAWDDLTRRLDELESRLRDVLEVRLSIHDKMERWERDGGPAVGEVRLRAARGE